MNPAPQVAKTTRRKGARLGPRRFCAADKTAVKRTYRLVKNAETAGLISASPSICNPKPTKRSIPIQKPPPQASRVSSPPEDGVNAATQTPPIPHLPALK